MAISAKSFSTGYFYFLNPTIMTEQISCNKECLVYPGGYAPAMEMATLLSDFKMPVNETVVTPPVNMNELADSFTIEVAVPGVRREDFFIHVHDNILSIMVLHKNCGAFTKGRLQIHEYDTEYFERHILLPDNAATEFVSAEYRQGILTLHIAKNGKTVKIDNNQIVVY
jgi:HSP20 family protein